MENFTPSKYYPSNPFPDNRQEKIVAVWTTHEATINQLVCLPGPVLKVLFLLGTCADPDGVARITVPRLSDRMQVSNALVNEAIRTLVLLNVVQRKAIGEFWLRPSIVRTIKILA